MTRLCVLCLISLCALSVLRLYKPEWAPFLRMAATVALAGTVLATAAEMLTDITALAGNALPSESYSVLLRSLGLAFATELCAGICRDSGEASLAGWVETVGRLEILVLALPLIRTLLETISGLWGGGA